MARINSQLTTSRMFLLAFVMIVAIIMSASAKLGADETDIVHVLPIATGSTSATVYGSIECPTPCKPGDKMKVDFAPGAQVDFVTTAAAFTLTDVDGAVLIDTILAIPSDAAPNVAVITIPEALQVTSRLQYAVNFSFKQVPKPKTDKKEPKVPLFPVGFSATVETTYSPKTAEGTDDTSRISNAKFTVIGSELIATKSEEFFLVSLHETPGAPSATDLSIVMEDIQVAGNEIYVSLYGQSQIIEDADLSKSTFLLNNLKVNQFVTLVSSALVNPFADAVPTLVIDYKAASTHYNFASTVIGVDSNLHLQFTFGPDVLPSHEIPLLSYVSVAIKKVEPKEGEATYGVVNSRFRPLEAKDVRLPVLTSTVTADANFLYQKVNIQYPAPTSIKDVKYSVSLRNARSQFAYVFLHNTTTVGTDFLESTLQSDKIYYNAHTFRTSVHDFQPMFRSAEFVSSTYSVLIVSPSNAKNSANSQFNLFVDIPAGPSKTIPFKMTSIVSLPKALPTITQYPQFDVQLKEEKKKKNSLSEVVMDEEESQSPFQILVENVFDGDERLFGSEETKFSNLLKFVIDFRKVKEIDATEVTFLNHQYVFVGSFDTGCTLDGTELPAGSITTTPLFDHPDLFTSINIKGAVKDDGHYYFTCKNGFITHREHYQTKEILDAYFPLHVVAYKEGVPVAASGIMFHFPRHSLSADLAFIIVCVIIGLIIIPLSQLFLCFIHPTKPEPIADADESLINSGLLAVEGEGEEDDESVLPQDRFTRPMHSVHRRLNLVTQSEDPHH